MRAFKNHKRENEILHNCMEYLALNYKTLEPAELTGSLYKLHKRLDTSRNRIVLNAVIGTAVLANLLIYLFILVKKFFR